MLFGCRQTKRFFSIFSIVKVLWIYESLILMPRAQPYRHERCSTRLENALEHMRRRSSGSLKSARSISIWNETPYDVYNKFYGPQESEEDARIFSDTGRNYNEHKYVNRHTTRPGPQQSDQQYNRPPSSPGNTLSVTSVDVEDLKVRLPQKVQARWVEIDKCKFSTENATLDTRLIFPDLTLSGRIVLLPTGGKCNMILRLRHAGIEFRTIPIGFNTKPQHPDEESRRLSAASVRTDSHFAEPGFISVFAHGCQGPTGIKLRQNSKRRFGFVPEHTGPQVELSDPQVVLGGAINSNRWGKFHNPFSYSKYDIRSEETSKHPAIRDQELVWENESGSREFFDVNGDNFYRKKYRRKRRDLRHSQYLRHSRQNDLNLRDDSPADIFNFSDNNFDNIIMPDARAFADIFSQNTGYGGTALFSGNSNNEHDEVNDALTLELEKLFSLGVRGLLTTYMQKTLQPAIKETLMENMGYTLSYG